MQTAAEQKPMDVLVRTLTWTTPGHEIKLAKAAYLDHLRAAFHVLFDGAHGANRPACLHDLQDLVSMSSSEDIDRVILCPNIANFLISGQALNEQALGMLVAAFTLQARNPQLTHSARPMWCPSGNKHIDWEAVVSQWPVLGDQIAVDFDSPDRIAIGSDVPAPAKNWRPLDEDKREAALGLLNEAHDCLRDVHPSLGIFIENTTRCLVLRQSDEVPFASFSSCNYIGRTALVNPHIMRPFSLCESLLHEAIHSYLCMLDHSPSWGLVSKSVQVTKTVRSSWTNRDLPLFAFLHACFVWYGLFFFWARLIQKIRGDKGEVLKHLVYTAAGFQRGDLPDLIDRRDRGLIKAQILSAIAAMQSNVVRVMGDYPR